MAGLNLTPRRLELLAAIDRGEVARHHEWMTRQKPRDVWAGQTVTSICNELAQAEPRLIRPGPMPNRGDIQPWVLTDAGRDALAAKES